MDLKPLCSVLPRVDLKPGEQADATRLGLDRTLNPDSDWDTQLISVGAPPAASNLVYADS